MLHRYLWEKIAPKRKNCTITQHHSEHGAVVEGDMLLHGLGLSKDMNVGSEHGGLVLLPSAPPTLDCHKAKLSQAGLWGPVQKSLLRSFFLLKDQQTLGSYNCLVFPQSFLITVCKNAPASLTEQLSV